MRLDAKTVDKSIYKITEDWTQQREEEANNIVNLDKKRLKVMVVNVLVVVKKDLNF